MDYAGDNGEEKLLCVGVLPTYSVCVFLGVVVQLTLIRGSIMYKSGVYKSIMYMYRYIFLIS